MIKEIMTMTTTIIAIEETHMIMIGGNLIFNRINLKNLINILKKYI